jgi:diamine N-acetyltransferase
MIHLSDSLYLKPLQMADAKQLSETAIRAYRDHYLYLWEDEGKNYLETVFNPDFLANDLQNPNHLYWLVIWQNQAEGFLKLKLTAPLENESNALELERIYLTQALSGQGVGQKIMNFIFDLAQKAQKDWVWLKAMDSSPAIGFYEKTGFEVCGTYHLDLPFMKDQYRGMLIMRKKMN